MHRSVTGATSDIESIDFLSTKMQALAFDLKSGKPASAMTADELRLDELVNECQEVSTKFLELLDRLKVKNSKSKPTQFLFFYPSSSINYIYKHLRKDCYARDRAS